MKQRKLKNIEGIECKPIKPSFAIEMQYSKYLSLLLAEYWQKLIEAATEIYRKDVEGKIVSDSAMAMDSSLAKETIAKLSKRVTELNEKYRAIFKKLPVFFIDKVEKKVNYDLKRSIASVVPQDLQFLVVNFNAESKRALISKDTLIKSNIELITGIDEEMQGRVQKALLDSLMRGKDVDYLEGELANVGSAKFSEKRKKLIARDQIRKATQIIDHATSEDIGITQHIWKHSKISKVPRQSHLHANNTVYDINKGCEIDGEFIYPAQLYGCNCYSAPFIPLKLP